MNPIQIQTTLAHFDTGLNGSGTLTYEAAEGAFSSDAITVTTTPESVTLGDIVTPRAVLVSLVSGSALQVGLNYGTDGIKYPFRLSTAGEPLLLRLDVEGLRQIDQLTFPADVAGSLGGKYFILDDRNSNAVWVWFNTGAGAGTTASGTITYGVPVNGDTVTVGGSPFTKAAAGSATEFSTIGELEALIEAVAGVDCTEDGTTISIVASSVGAAGNDIALSRTGTGTMAVSGSGFLAGGVDPSVAPIASSSRLIEASITVGATADAVATAVAAALNADPEFTAVASGANVTITDRHTGTRSGANANGISGLTVLSPNPQDGADSPVIHLKSTGTSQVLVAVAPN